MTRRASEGVGMVWEVAGRVCEAAWSASKAAGWASQAAGRYYQKHAFENRINVMILHSTVNRPLVMAHEYEYEFKCSAKITTTFHKLRLQPNSRLLADLLRLYTSSNSFSHPVGKSSKQPLRWANAQLPYYHLFVRPGSCLLRKPKRGIWIPESLMTSITLMK